MGTSSRTVLELRPGEVVQPLSIGRSAMWPIEAPQVLDVHAFLYFDGRALFFQSSNPSQPARGNGQAIGADWQQVEIPCTIEIGRARLVYRTLDLSDDAEEIEPEEEEDKTIAAPLKAVMGGGAGFGAPQQQRPGPGASGPFRPGEFSNRQTEDEESTRFSPIGREPSATLVNPLEARPSGGGLGMGGGRARPAAGIPAVTPAAGMPAAPATAPTPWIPGRDDLPPPSSTTVGPAPIGAPLPPPPQASGYQDMGNVQIAMPPPPQQQQYPAPNAAETGRLQVPPDKPASEWEQMPVMRKVILSAMPVAIVAVYFLLFVDDPTPPPTTKLKPDAGMEASVASAPSATVTNTVPTVVTTDTVPTTTTTTTTTTTAPTVTVPPTASTAAIPIPIPSATVPLKKGEVTKERLAADAVRQGHKAEAITLYEQLAAEHPENPAFKEAVRVLKSE